MLRKIIAVLLASSMLLMCSPSVFADEEGEILPTDPIDTVIESLDVYNYGGVYVENGQAYISAVNVESLSRVLSTKLSKNRSVDLQIAENTVKYSYGELLDAQEKIVQSMESENEYAIYETYIGQKDNVLGVGSPEWTDDKKQEVSKLSGIDTEHISFYIVTEEDVEKEFFPEEINEEVDSTTERATTLTPKPGDKLVCNSKAFSLCTPVVWGQGTAQKGGFITCAHTEDKTGQAIKDANGNIIGCGSVWEYGGYYDFTLVERASNNVKGSFVLPDGKKIQASKAPIEGETIYRYGQHHPTPVSGTVIKTDVKVKHTGTGVVITGFKTDAPIVAGDSGGPIMTNSSTGKYVLVGLNSTVNFGTYIRNILSNYNAKLSSVFPDK